jgi:hypothetical protein
VALGAFALSADTLGSQSTAIGFGALQSQNLTTATTTYNTAVGVNAGQDITTGTSNTLIGAEAGNAITTGTTNTLVGAQTGTFGDDIITGTANVIFGAYSTGTSTSANDQHGFGYNLDCAANFTTLGAGSSDSRLAHGGTTWATISDERYKKDITDSTVGLSFINALKPRTFKYRNKGELPNTFRAYEENSSEVFKSAQTQHGFIAQEVKQAIDADSGVADGFKLWDERDDGSQEVAESALIPMLVKAIQELTARIEALES